MHRSSFRPLPVRAPALALALAIVGTSSPAVAAPKTSSAGQWTPQLLTREQEQDLEVKDGKKGHALAETALKARAKKQLDFVTANPEAKDAEGETVTVKSGSAFPEKFDWTELGMVTPVKSQVGGTCWAFSETAAMESAYLMRHHESLDLFEQDMIDCSCRKCDGSSPNQSDEKEVAGWRLQGDKTNLGDGAGTACKVTNCSPCSLKKTPYRLEFARVLVDPEYTIEGKHPHDPVPVAQMKAALLAHGPLNVKMHIPPGSKVGSHSGTGVFKETEPLIYEPEQNSGAHIVNIVGWDDGKKAWRVKNSWGTGWGDGGFAWIAYGSNNLGMSATWGRAEAPEHRVTAVWRKSAAKEVQIHGWTYADYQAKYDQLWTKGWRIHLLETNVDDGKVVYNAVWRKGDAAEKQYYAQTHAEYQKRYDELWAKGWRIFILNTYVVGGKIRYDAVWRPGDQSETQFYGMTHAAYQKKYDELWKKDWRIHLLNQYVVDGVVKYDAVWRPGQTGEMQFYDLTFAQFAAKQEALAKDGWRLHILNNHRKGGKVRYSAVWRPGSADEMKIYAWDYEAFRAKDKKLRDKGWRLHILNAF
jgi:hypothetical protein